MSAALVEGGIGGDCCWYLAEESTVAQAIGGRRPRRKNRIDLFLRKHQSGSKKQGANDDDRSRRRG